MQVEREKVSKGRWVRWSRRWRVENTFEVLETGVRNARPVVCLRFASSFQPYIIVSGRKEKKRKEEKQGEKKRESQSCWSQNYPEPEDMGLVNAKVVVMMYRYHATYSKVCYDGYFTRYCLMILLVKSELYHQSLEHGHLPQKLSDIAS